MTSYDHPGGLAEVSSTETDDHASFAHLWSAGPSPFRGICGLVSQEVNDYPLKTTFSCAWVVIVIVPLIVT